MPSKLIVTTGVYYDGKYDGMPRTFSVDIDNEFQPDQVFRACNRINDLEEDLRALPNEWQKELRRILDEVQAPSMSSGDMFLLVMPNNRRYMRWTCERRGWTTQQYETRDLGPDWGL